MNSNISKGYITRIKHIFLVEKIRFFMFPLILYKICSLVYVLQINCINFIEIFIYLCVTWFKSA